LNDSQAGVFFSVQFFGSMCGVWITTFLTSWRGYRPGLVLGYIVTGIGLAALNAPTPALALAATAAFGLGYGMVTPPTNLSAAEAGGERSAGMVSLLNFAWGIGAVACSPLVMLALRHDSLSMLLRVFALCGFILAMAFLFVAFPERHTSSAQSASGAATVPGLAVTITVTALFFLYVGMEASTGGWAAEHTKRLASTGTSLSTIAPMFFYGGLMAGRAAATLVLEHVRENRVIAGALGLSGAGIGVVILATSQDVAIVGLVIAGIGCASIYPLYIAWFSKWYGAAARKIGGLMFSMASVGASVTPWLVGVTSQHSGSLRIGLLVPLVGCSIMGVLVAGLHRQRLV
jgi:FHS family glucose/mannose:H+ symporter-like MFS transporter